MAFSRNFRKRILANYFVAAPTYVALFNGEPTNGGAGVDASDYERTEIDFTEPREFEDKISIDNRGTVEFFYAESDWGEVTHVAVMDASEGGEILDYTELNNPAEIEHDTQFWIDQGGYLIEWS